MAPPMSRNSMDSGGVVLGSATALKWSHRDLSHLEAVLRLVPERHVAVQAGGNLGVFPRYLSERFSVTYTFEPAPDAFRMMLQNAPAENIVAFQAALGAEPALVGLSRVRRDGKPDAHEGITYVTGKGTIHTLTIDTLALDVCDLVYLDIEGSELAAIKGAEQTLTRCRPVVALEVNKNLQYVGVTEADIYAFMALMGYRHALTVGSDRAFVPVEMACP
jgi:FkbM family methyltransferase